MGARCDAGIVVFLGTTTNLLTCSTLYPNQAVLPATTSVGAVTATKVDPCGATQEAWAAALEAGSFVSSMASGPREAVAEPDSVSGSGSSGDPEVSTQGSAVSQDTCPGSVAGVPKTQAELMQLMEETSEEMRKATPCSHHSVAALSINQASDASSSAG